MGYDLLYKKPTLGGQSGAIFVIAALSGMLFISSSIVLIARGSSGPPPPTAAEEIADAREEERTFIKQNGGKPPTPRQVVLRALAKANTYRFSRTIRYDGLSSQSRIPTVRMTGVADVEKDLVLIGVDPTDAAGVVGAGKTLIHDGAIYMEVTPDMRTEFNIPEGKRWARMDYPPGLGVTMGAFAGIDATSSIGRTRLVGEDAAGGERIRRYRSKLDAGAMLRAMKKAIESFGQDPEDVDLQITGWTDHWIDERGYVVRSRAVSVQTPGRPIKTVMSETLSAHNRPSGLSVPRKGEVHVVKFPDFREGFGGSSTSDTWSEESDSVTVESSSDS